MIEDSKLQTLLAGRDKAAFLTYVFNNLPTPEFISSLGSLSDAAEAGSYAAGIASSMKEFDNPEKALLEVSKDRARLLRAISEDGPKPPVEGLYVKDMVSLYGSLRDYFSQAGVDRGPTFRERLDYLGTELAYFDYVLRKYIENVQDDEEKAESLLELAKSFFESHMKNWMYLAASEIQEKATTKFYREVGALLSSMLDDFAAVFA